MVGVIVSLFFISALFFLWQFSRGEQVGKRISFLINIWVAVIVFYLVMKMGALVAPFSSQTFCHVHFFSF